MPLHIAGLPVEELLAVALVSALPVFALVAMEVRDRIRRAKSWLGQRRPPDINPLPGHPRRP